MGLRYNPSISIVVSTAQGLADIARCQLERSTVANIVKQHPRLVRFHIDKKDVVSRYRPTLDFIREHLEYTPEIYESKVRRRNENVLIVHHAPTDRFYLIGDLEILNQ